MCQSRLKINPLNTFTENNGSLVVTKNFFHSETHCVLPKNSFTVKHTVCFTVKELFGNHETAIIFSILFSKLVLYSEPVAVARSYPIFINT